jgi:hypothetical protein
MSIEMHRTVLWTLGEPDEIRGVGTMAVVLRRSHEHGFGKRQPISSIQGSLCQAQNKEALPEKTSRKQPQPLEKREQSHIFRSRREPP